MEKAAGVFWFIWRRDGGEKLVRFSTACVRTAFPCSSAFRARISFVRILFSSRRSDDLVRASSLPLSQGCDGLCVPVRSCPPAWYSGSTVSFVPCTGKRFLTSPENLWAILSAAVPTADCICSSALPAGVFPDSSCEAGAAASRLSAASFSFACSQTRCIAVFGALAAFPRSFGRMTSGFVLISFKRIPP